VSRRPARATREPSRGRKWPIPRPQRVHALQYAAGSGHLRLPSNQQENPSLPASRVKHRLQSGQLSFSMLSKRSAGQQISDRESSLYQSLWVPSLHSRRWFLLGYWGRGCQAVRSATGRPSSSETEGLDGVLGGFSVERVVMHAHTREWSGDAHLYAIIVHIHGGFC